MYGDVRTHGRLLSNSSYPSYGRFVEPDPIGYEEGPNLYSYVGNDPINWTDPLGLCAAGEARVYAGSYGVSDGQGGGTITAIFRCVRVHSSGGGGGSVGGGGGGGGGGGIDVGSLVRGFGGALDRFAEEYLKPPPEKQPGETSEQCEARIAGAAPALGVAGASGVAAGGAYLGYPRGTISGGGSGTSLISSAARSSFGKAKFSGGLGTGSVGGFIGRFVSRVSVVVGAAEVGLAIGITAGAKDRCK